MNRRVSVILLAALLISAGASYFVYRRVALRMSSSATVATTSVVVAVRDLEVGTLIKESDVGQGSWVGAVPKGMATRKDTLLGRGVIAAVYEGEPILETRLAPEGAGGGLAATIPPGMRACAVKVNEIVGVAGFVVPGMRVDVLISGSPMLNRQQGDTRVKTILQNIAVLSAGQNYQKDAEGKPVTVQVVNLLVTPDQAEILSLASNEARIQLVLRNPLDKEVAKTSGTAVATLFGDAPRSPSAPTRVVRVAARQTPKAEEPKPIPVYLVDVINGPKRTEAKLPQRLEEQK